MGERMTTGAIYDEARVGLADLMEDAKERMFREAMNGMIRQIMKETTRQSQEAVRAPALSPELERLEVPRCIALPAQSGSREMEWVPTFRATPNELMRHIKYLRENARADLEKAKKLQVFHDELLKVVNVDDLDQPIEDLIAQARAA
ncbi:hypothetical protein JL111_20505 [Paracoccus sp. KCTC 42845]|uniref:Uncharacterized protein n=2 Tax=Paracoccus aerius TaxID=1915382 RepID=A0ABS1SCJ7_9RHOB|nr:hypothetical protein [Paracoccus aerius]